MIATEINELTEQFKRLNKYSIILLGITINKFTMMSSKNSKAKNIDILVDEILNVLDK